MHFSFLLDTLAAVLIQMSFSEWGLLIDPGPGGSDGVLKQGPQTPETGPNLMAQFFCISECSLRTPIGPMRL